jgi:hypothetical protein
LIEYRGKSPRVFSVHRRKARSIDGADRALEFRPHRRGAVVQLYGFSGLLQSDLTRGGAFLST